MCLFKPKARNICQYSWVWLILHQACFMREIERQTDIVIHTQEVVAKFCEDCPSSDCPR